MCFVIVICINKDEVSQWMRANERASGKLNSFTFAIKAREKERELLENGIIRDNLAKPSENRNGSTFCFRFSNYGQLQ